MTQPTEGTLSTISVEDAFTKGSLMQADTHSRCDISSSARIHVIPHRWPLVAQVYSDAKVALVINGYGECGTWKCRIIANHKNRPGGNIASTGNPMKIGQRQTIRHSGTKPMVIPMIRINTSIPIAK